MLETTHSRVKTRIYPEFEKASFLVYGLIVSIAIFFAGAMVAYAVRFIVSTEAPPAVPLPPQLWVSTALLLIGSHLLFHAWKAVRLERQRKLRIYVSLSLGFAICFCVIQTWGMWQLLDLHWKQDAASLGSAASVLMMVFLHVAHFFAGVIGLGYVTVQSFRGRYDHEFFNGVRLAAIYWRFLDVVWLLLLGLFLLAGR